MKSEQVITLGPESHIGLCIQACEKQLNKEMHSILYDLKWDYKGVYMLYSDECTVA